MRSLTPIWAEKQEEEQEEEGEEEETDEEPEDQSMWTSFLFYLFLVLAGMRIHWHLDSILGLLLELSGFFWPLNYFVEALVLALPPGGGAGAGDGNFGDRHEDGEGNENRSRNLPVIELRNGNSSTSGDLDDDDLEPSWEVDFEDGDVERYEDLCSFFGI